MNNLLFAGSMNSRPVVHAADSAFYSPRRMAGPFRASSAVVWACNSNKRMGITRNILSVIAAVLFMNAITSCSFREGDDSVPIKDGSGEVPLRFPVISAGYNICMTPVGFDVGKSQNGKNVLIIEVENNSDNEMEIWWGGPQLSEGIIHRITGHFLLPNIGSRESQGFVDMPDRSITGKSYLIIDGGKNPTKFILRLQFTKPVNGSVKIHHKSSDL
jgi:hypothetical protein